MKIETYARGPFATNTYLLLDEEGGRGYVVDPTLEIEEVARSLQERGVEILAVIDTHCHLDHAYHNALFCEKFEAPLWAHEADLPLLQKMETQAQMFGLEPATSPDPDRFLADGDVIPLGPEELKVFHTPGHSPGGICLAGPGLVIVGDTLFAGSIGRTDLWGGDFATLRSAIHDKLFTLPDATRVLPGHGPETTIGQERLGNPFVGEHADIGEGGF